MQLKEYSYSKDFILNSMAAAVAIFLHLWGVFSIGQQEYLLASVLLLVGQFVLGMQIQWKINNGLHVSDIRIGFLVFYFLYGVVLPLSTLFGFGSVQGTYPGDPGLYGAAFLYASGLLAFNIVQIFWPTKWKNPELRENVKKQYFVGSIIILLVLLYGVIFYALSLGVELRFDIDRSGRSHLNIQSWDVLIFVLQGVIYYLLWQFRNMKLISRLMVLSGFSLFVLFAMLSLGERRSFFPLLLFSLAIYNSQRKLRVGVGAVALFFVLGIGMFSVGAIRERKFLPEQTLIEEIQQTFSNNEFSIPIQNLMAYINTPNKWAPRWGITYVSWPGYFVPREWWSDKPVSLSAQVPKDTGWGVPAYTPVVEAFVNFLWVGPFLVCGIFSVLMNFMVRRAAVYPVLYFVFLSYVVDFNRGEVGLTLYGIFVALGMFAIMTFIRSLDFFESKREMCRSHL